MNFNLLQPAHRILFILIHCFYFVFTILPYCSSPLLAAPLSESQNNAIHVAIDPGHGGKDEGGKGASGLIEKNITLEMAQILSQWLAPPQFRVTLTRIKDDDVKLVQRAAIANQANADIFISLHTGGSYVHSFNDITIFFHRLQNIPTPTTNAVKPHSRLQWDQTQSHHQAASKALALALKQQIEQMPDLPPCRIQDAPLIVLEGADMPAVLIEIGHLTNPTMETRMATSQYQKQFAEKIVMGILAFEKGQENAQTHSD